MFDLSSTQSRKVWKVSSILSLLLFILPSLVRLVWPSHLEFKSPKLHNELEGEEGGEDDVEGVQELGVGLGEKEILGLVTAYISQKLEI